MIDCCCVALTTVNVWLCVDTMVCAGCYGVLDDIITFLYRCFTSKAKVKVMQGQMAGSDTLLHTLNSMKLATALALTTGYDSCQT
jgi:hypothetical protein